MSKNVLLVGNPNCGKTTLFNLLTGQHQKVGNWSGVTTEGKIGCYKKDNSVVITDLPGVYSLSARTDDEKAVVERLKEKNIDVIINVVDGLNLERNLYLSTELLSLGFPIILAINFSDQIKKRKIKIDLKKLSSLLGVEVIMISAATNDNVNELMKLIEASAKTRKDSAKINYNLTLRERYLYIEKILRDSVVVPESDSGITKKLDNILMHKVFGLPIFFAVMCFTYFLSIKVGGALGGIIENIFDDASKVIFITCNKINLPEWLTKLMCQAIIKGLGTVCAFLPQILILFGVLTLLEESGYSARAAFIIDRLFSFFGLSGKAFIPMMLCTGCTVTGLMATRTIDGESEKLSSIFLSPFMPCGAKMAVFGWFVSVFFNGSAMLATTMYFLAIFCVIMLGRIVNIITNKHNESVFLLEIPTLKIPRLKVVFQVLAEKIKDYSIKVGSIVFILSIALWFLSSFGARGYVGEKVEFSFLFTLGNGIKWIFYPLGFGSWQASVAVLSGTLAKEAVVETLALLVNEPSSIFHNAHNVYSFCAFILLAPPCCASIVQAYRELKSKKLLLLMLTFQFAVAYIVAFTINVLGLIFSTLEGLIIFLILVIIIVALMFAAKIGFSERCCGMTCTTCKGAKKCLRKEKHSTI